jgi:DUF4097 and DUF4098 domain-containing protein YvlB
MIRQFLALVAAATVAPPAPGQTSTPVTREDGYWVQTVAGEFPLSNVVRLQVRSRGSVTVHGDSETRLRYTLRKRVRAGSESEARRVFETIEARLVRKGALADLHLVLPARNLPSPELRVECPRGFRYYSIFTDGGSLDMRSLDGDVEAATLGGRVKADDIGGALIARTGGGDIDIGTVRGMVRSVTGGGPIHAVSVGGEGWFDTGGGGIVVEEAAGPVHASTGAGNIEVKRAKSSVAARSLGGFIRVNEAAGMVNVESAGGGIQVSSAKGVRCESVGGGIRLLNVSGELKVATAIGSILAELLRGIETSYISTGSGDITILIPSNLAVTVQAHNDRFGRIVSDFPEVRVQTPRAWQGGVVANGAINGGGPVLTIAAADGTIFLRRQK